MKNIIDWLKLGLTLVVLLMSMVAYAHVYFAPKKDVECLAGDINELTLNMRLMVERSGQAWIEVK